MAPRVPEAIGDYKIVEEIGHGGMGTLYRARDPKIGRDVAIKLLREGLDDKDMRERFAREARSAGRLKHGNIVTIFELGEHNNMPFIAMEYVQGETLAAFLRRRPPVPLTRKLQIMDQVCAGLHYAHRMGIVHRDIKPANIMIDDEGTLKLLDFGIARMGASKITQTGMVIGTLNYMAPEQMKGMSTDARADMFSIGAVFYELLSYRNAFAGDAPSTVMHKILYGRPDELEIVCPNLDPALVTIVGRCLEKQRENRYPDLGAVRSALAAVSRRIEAASVADNEDDPTLPIVMPGIELPRGQTPGSGGSRKDSAGMEQMLLRAEQTRAKQIQVHIDNGRRALERGDFDAAFAACEQALVLDPTCPQALDLEARARAIVDRQQEERLSAARAEIDRGALTAAGLLADQVLAINAESEQALAIRQEVEEGRRRLAEELERERERQRAFGQACSDAQRHLASGSLDSAVQAIERALTLDPTRAEALALKEKITAAVSAAREARRRAEEEARARKAVEDAKVMFGKGEHAQAFSILEGLARHPFVAAELDALKLEAREMERRRAELERKSAEAQRQKLEAEAARLKNETDAARKRLEAEVERLKRESEAERLELEAEAARLKREAEAERQKRQAEAERLKREAETARRQREAEAERLTQQAGRPLEHTQPVERLPSSLRTPFAPPERKPAAPAPPMASQPPPRPELRSPAVSGSTPQGASKGLALGVIALVAAIVVALGITIIMKWGAGGETTTDSGVASTTPIQTRTPPVATEASPSTQLPAGNVSASPDAAPGAPSADQIKDLRMAQVRRLIERADYDAAIAQADQILALDPREPEAIELRAKAVASKRAAPPGRGGQSGQPKPNTLRPDGPGVANDAITPKPPVDPGATRARELTDRYNQARSALDGGAFSTAVPLLDQLQRDEPNYRDVPALRARAREGLANAARQALDNGAKLENSGDLPGAVQQYERGRQIDPSVAAAADQSINRVRARMKTEGADAFGQGRQYDALDRIEQAIAQYERAVRYLPDDDPNKKIARDRLQVLRARR